MTTDAREEPIVDGVGLEHGKQDAICLDHVSYRYSDGTLALEDVTLHVHTGAMLAIVGPNGAGKTTLLKIILGVLRPGQGAVKVFGMTPEQARRRGDVLGWVPQRPSLRWDFPVTVNQVVRMGLLGKIGLFGRPTAEDSAHVARVMRVLEIDTLADRTIGELSGGQQQRAVIARALASRPRILLFDEPTVGLDTMGRQSFHGLLGAIETEFGVTIVMVSHDLETMAQHVQRVACLDRTLHFHDTPEQLTDALVSKLFGCGVQALLGTQNTCDISQSPIKRPGERK